MNIDMNDFISEEVFSGGDFSVKANICIANQNIHCGSNLLFKKFYPNYNSTSIELLSNQGLKPKYIVHMDEFAMGGIGRSPVSGLMTHPFLKECIVGGSSSGSAKSVALDLVSFSLGSSTGGSVRFPAALCNIIGFEPSYGAISRYGLVAFASSLDKIGIISKDMKIIKSISEIIIKKDCNDMTTIQIERSNKKPTNILALDPEIIKNFVSENVFKKYKETILMISNLKLISDEKLISYFSSAAKSYFIISSVEAFSNLRRFNGLRFLKNDPKITFEESLEFSFDLFQNEVKERINLAKFVLEQYPSIYTDCIGKRIFLTKLMNDNFLNENNILITPSLSSESILKSEVEKPNLDLSKFDIFLSWVNLIKGCAITLPFNDTNIQFVAKQGNDFTLLNFVNEVIK